MAKKKRNDPWLSLWMAPYYGDTVRNPGGLQGQPDVIYAPDLATAFKLARCQWPTACSWACLGEQDPNDAECVLE